MTLHEPPFVWATWQDAEFHIHRFPDGVLVYSARRRTTYLLPHLPGQVFLILHAQNRGLTLDEVASSVGSHAAASGLSDKKQVAAALDNLVEQRLLQVTDAAQ